MSIQKKVVILGDSGVGKTSILFRYLYDKFDSSNMPTLGASFKSRIISIPNEGDIKLNLWDTAGQEKFKSLTRMYYQDAEAALIVYDTTFKESFDSAKNWVKDLQENASIPNILIALVGNKCDLTDKQEVNLEEAHMFARQVNAEIIKETSAKDNNGINDLFMEIGSKLHKKHKMAEAAEDRKKGEGQKKPGSQKLEAKNHDKKGGKDGKKGGGCCK